MGLFLTALYLFKYYVSSTNYVCLGLLLHIVYSISRCVLFNNRYILIGASFIAGVVFANKSKMQFAPDITV
jgi:hypothetical protein